MLGRFGNSAEMSDRDRKKHRNFGFHSSNNNLFYHSTLHSDVSAVLLNLPFISGTLGETKSQ